MKHSPIGSGSAVVIAVIALGSCNDAQTKPEAVDMIAPAQPSIVAAPPTAVPAAAEPLEASKAFNPRLLRRFAPLRSRIESAEAPATEAQIALGRTLYFDKRLSRNRDVSCNSCHRLDAYGVDGEATSRGDKGQRGARNSPTVYNAAGHFAEFWDGRAANVEEQAKGPILNPLEMAMPNAQTVVARLKAVPGYVEAFEKAFPNTTPALSYDHVGLAIGAFERGLTTPARWDKFLTGDTSALSAAEVEGLKTFTNSGCMVCHTGEFLGGNSYQRVGAVEPWPNQEDVGRGKVTKDKADSMMFKVPTLRNITKTGPYFHDGSVATLDQAVRMMGKHQLGVELSDAEIQSIVTWLGSLTGELPTAYIAEPALPPDPEKLASR